MKIDRLLSILIYLLNRDLVSARELADHFEVSLRTIQRDMDTLTFAGIPIRSVQGPKGGYGIMDRYKLDRQLVNTSDLFFILTALESIGSTFKNKEMQGTLEKIKTLVRDHQSTDIKKLRDQLYIDFGAFSIGKNSSELFYLLEESIEKQRLIAFTYTDSFSRDTRRTVEPMTIVFKWYSWYLFGFCRLRDDYRLFRLSRMQNVQSMRERFVRRDGTFEALSHISHAPDGREWIDAVFKFHGSMRLHVEDYFRNDKIDTTDDGSLRVKVRLLEDDWLHGMILSYGDRIEVLEPASLRQTILKKSQTILKKYLD